MEVEWTSSATLNEYQNSIHAITRGIRRADKLPANFDYKRIIIVGTTSSGKSTLAKKLSEKLNLDFVELDALHWEPNWMEAPDNIFRKRVENAISSERWVVAGNYKNVRDLTWSKAEALIWLDYPLGTIFWWLTRRIFKRWWSQELLWGTNRENILTHFKLWSQDSLYHWLFKTYWRRKREFTRLISEPSNAHLTVFHFKSPHEAEKLFTT